MGLRSHRANCSTLQFVVTNASRSSAPGSGVRAAARHGKEHCGVGKTTQQLRNRPSVVPVFIVKEFFYFQDTGNLANFPEEAELRQSNTAVRS